MELDPAMSVAQFQSSYFYAAELRQFAQRLGITVGNARKHEVEALILECLGIGEVPEHRPVNPRRAGTPRDALDPGNQVLNYVGDARTKQFCSASPGPSRRGLPTSPANGTGSTTGAGSSRRRGRSSATGTWATAFVH